MRTTSRRTAALASLLVATSSLCVAAAGTAGAAGAATNTAPRIVGASMVDVDHDDRADRLVLTWSEAVTHSADSDGHYPISVTGYVVRSIASASRSRTLVVNLREHSSRDISAHPSVRYAATRLGPVVDALRLQAATQGFTRTLPLDRDHDGYAAKDCKPTLAGVHPGAADAPDTSLLDSNCDGIDGQKVGPVFVSPSGSDSNAGTITAPVQTLAQALTTAGSSKPIYLADGTYPSAVSTAFGNSVYGGYAPSTWSRSLAGVSTISVTKPLPLTGNPTLQLLRVTAAGTTDPDGTVAVSMTTGVLTLTRAVVSSGAGAAATSGNAALNSIALRATDATVQVSGGSLSAGKGGAGLAGTSGTSGAPGSDGGDGGAADCTLSLVPGLGGLPGSSPTSGHGGGLGGLGGNLVVPALPGYTADSSPGGGAGANAATGTAGVAGTPGAVGSTGDPGSPLPGAFSADTFTPGTSTAGTIGTDGHGGGGGGGGGASTSLPLASGGGGGGGGGGGAPGTGGTGGTGGGASVALWAKNSVLDLVGTTLTTAGGGNGGPAGTGGAGGAGGGGGAGGAACANALGSGGNGGTGGTGGAGGDGGAGTGGASVGIVRAAGSMLSQSGVTIQTGAPGTSPAGPAYAGQTSTVLTIA